LLSNIQAELDRVAPLKDGADRFRQTTNVVQYVAPPKQDFI